MMFYRTLGDVLFPSEDWRLNLLAAVVFSVGPLIEIAR